MPSFSDIVKDHREMRETIAKIEALKKNIRAKEKEFNPDQEIALRSNQIGISGESNEAKKIIDDLVSNNVGNIVVLLKTLLEGVKSGELSPYSALVLWSDIRPKIGSSYYSSGIVDATTNLSTIFNASQTREVYTKTELKTIEGLIDLINKEINNQVYPPVQVSDIKTEVDRLLQTLTSVLPPAPGAPAPTLAPTPPAVVAPPPPAIVTPSPTAAPTSTSAAPPASTSKPAPIGPITSPTTSSPASSPKPAVIPSNFLIDEKEAKIILEGDFTMNDKYQEISRYLSTLSYVVEEKKRAATKKFNIEVLNMSIDKLPDWLATLWIVSLYKGFKQDWLNDMYKSTPPKKSFLELDKALTTLINAQLQIQKNSTRVLNKLGKAIVSDDAKVKPYIDNIFPKTGSGVKRGKGLGNMKQIISRTEDLMSVAQKGHKTAEVRNELDTHLSMLIDKNKITAQYRDSIMKKLFR
jgi:hypothetical protein